MRARTIPLWQIRSPGQEDHYTVKGGDNTMAKQPKFDDSLPKRDPRLDVSNIPNSSKKGPCRSFSKDEAAQGYRGLGGLRKKGSK